MILAELKRSHQNMSMAAKSLGLERSHLYKKAEQLGIDLRAMRREQGRAGLTSSQLNDLPNSRRTASIGHPADRDCFDEHSLDPLSRFYFPCTCFAVEPPSPAAYGVRMEQAWIPMKDGVRLAATLYMPDGAKVEREVPCPAGIPSLPQRRWHGGRRLSQARIFRAAWLRGRTS